jgi:hypothetical protein
LKIAESFNFRSIEIDSTFEILFFEIGRHFEITRISQKLEENLSILVWLRMIGIAGKPDRPADLSRLLPRAQRPVESRSIFISKYTLFLLSSFLAIRNSFSRRLGISARLHSHLRVRLSPQLGNCFSSDAFFSPSFLRTMGSARPPSNLATLFDTCPDLFGHDGDRFRSHAAASSGESAAFNLG